MRQLVYTWLITINPDLLHLWRQENVFKHQKVSKYYDQDCRREGQETKEESSLCTNNLAGHQVSIGFRLKFEGSILVSRFRGNISTADFSFAIIENKRLEFVQNSKM